MEYYLIQGSYAATAIEAMKNNPHDREAQARKLISSAGGILHHFFFTFGDRDWLLICELPDDTAATAVSITVGASGSITNTKTVKLISSDRAMAAMQLAKSLTYTAPTFSELIVGSLS